MRGAALLLMLGVLTLPTIALANDDCVGDPTCSVGAGSGGFSAEVSEENGGESAGAAPPGGSVVASPTDLVGDGLDALCVTTAVETGRDPMTFCGLEDGERPELTPGMIAAAFGTIRPPPVNLLIQPSNGRTLVNFETNFYTDAQPFDASLQLIGHLIEFRIRPATFTWHYGDGSVESTSSPGAAYPDLEITHTYLSKGTVGPSVDTTYAATYRVDGQGPWRDVDGTVTIAGAPASLEVLTATPVLVGYDG